MHSTEGIKTKTRWKALMEKRVCDTCLLWNECSTRIGKKARVLYFNEHYIVRHKRYRAIERLPEELRKLRANVEATIQ
jgi:Ni/Co efflux regulator RcnB